MEEQLVSFETAKLAETKGFVERVQNAFATDYLKNRSKEKAIVKKELGCAIEDKIQISDNMYEAVTTYSTYINHKNQPQILARPSQAFLQQWLRINHNTHIIIQVSSAGDGEEKIKWYYSYVTGIHDCLSDEAFGCTCDDVFNTYEEALEEALKVTLDCIF